ncbi:MAG: UDP-3-O-(3-hydroxymyristoyl)glucosamine N-acyltransferase [Candidatus Omnitrophota bacterium]|nr:UDP-3-O-(3-hydroxymyristoyl)glucosamine N-acyltransferase [Candidatus Omnitrophota bacterium]
MEKTLKEITEIIAGKLDGDSGIVINGVSGIKEANQGEITFIANSRYRSLAEQTRASAIILSKNLQVKTNIPLIRTENPSFAFAKVLGVFSESKISHPAVGIHPSAVIGKNVKLGSNLAIQAHTMIEDNVEIGDEVIIYAGVYIGKGSRIGSNTVLYPHVSVREGVTIGNRVIIHNGTVVGSDGFGYIALENIQHKIPQVGRVIIEDDVEIGANVTIDRARFNKTIIGRGTKIDNLVQIAHNVIIGANSTIVAQTGISGSTVIGKNVILAGQAGVVGHITIGDNCIVGAQAGVSKSLINGSQVVGSPARPFSLAKRMNVCMKRLPEIFKRVAALEKKTEGKDEIAKNHN